jgi:hypothetical protein
MDGLHISINIITHSLLHHALQAAHSLLQLSDLLLHSLRVLPLEEDGSAALVGLQEGADNGGLLAGGAFLLLRLQLLAQLGEVLGHVPKVVAHSLQVFELAEGQVHPNQLLLSVLADLQGPAVAVLQRFEEDLEEVAPLADVAEADLGDLDDLARCLDLEVIELLEQTVDDLEDALGGEPEQFWRAGCEFGVLLDQFLNGREVLHCPGGLPLPRL